MDKLLSYQFEYIDELGERHVVDFTIGEYDNLMVLLWDKCYEEWGDCKGRAWCGTCHIEVLDGTITEPMDIDETKTLSGLPNLTTQSRLACQIPIDANLSGLTFKMLKDDGR